MTFVNLFSQYIKKIANETDIDYADALKSFEKSKRLQADWKAYRDAELKRKPYLFKPPVIERIIHFENVSPILENINIPLPTQDTTISVSRDSPNSLIVEEEDLGGWEETKGEDNERLKRIIENLIIENDISKPPTIILPPSKSIKPPSKTEETKVSQPIKPPSKSEKPQSKTSKAEMLKNIERDLWGGEEGEEEETITIKPKFTIIRNDDGSIKKVLLKKEKAVKGEGLEEYLPVRRNYPPKSREVIFYYGNEKIKDMKLVRTEISPVIFNTVNLLTEYTTGGKFQERFKKMPYDKLYHLALIVTTQEGSVIKIEKNEVLNIELNPTISPNAEIKQITTNVPRDLTISIMLYKAQSRMGGKRYFSYNAHTNNCQDYILNILEANNIGDESDYAFIKQDIDALFKGFEGTSNFLSLLTSIASIANRLIYGEGIEGKSVAGKDYVVQTIIFNKNKWNTDSADKWLKTHKYKNKGVDDKPNTLRFRQVNPDYVERKGFVNFKTKPLGKSGISIVIAYKKNK
jgi:hypothetical protein